MKTTHRTALFATALCALVASQSAFAADPVLPEDSYVDLAKQLNSAAPADTTNIVASALGAAFDGTGDAARQALGEVSAALAAVSSVKAEGEDGTAAAALFQTVVAEAYKAGDKAEALAFAKIAAAAGALVAPGAAFLDGAESALPKKAAKEVKNALADCAEALDGLDAHTIQKIYEDTLAALRAGSYKMKEDSDAVALAPVAANDDITVSFDGAGTATVPERTGIHVSGAPAPVVVPPVKKHKKNPTETQQR